MNGTISTSVYRKAAVTMPYIGGLSEAIRRILMPFDIQVVFHSLNTLRRLASQIPSPNGGMERSGHSIPCTDCPKVYIGQMGRCLKLRLEEHRRVLRNGDVAASAIAEHTSSTGHDMDLTKSMALDCHPHTTTKWHIQRSTDKLNRE